MIADVSVGYAGLLLLFVWRAYSLFRHGGLQGRPPPWFLSMYLLPLVALAIVGVIAALFTSPFAASASAPPGFPLGLRQFYVLISHLTYAATGASIIFLVLSHRQRGSVQHAGWTLIASFVALTLLFITTIVSANYDQIVFGASFVQDRQHVTRLIFLGVVGLSILATTWRTFRYRQALEDGMYWIEPLLLIIGIIAKGMGAATFLNFDPLPWL